MHICDCKPLIIIVQQSSSYFLIDWLLDWFRLSARERRCSQVYTCMDRAVTLWSRAGVGSYYYYVSCWYN